MENVGWGRELWRVLLCLHPRQGPCSGHRGECYESLSYQIPSYCGVIMAHGWAGPPEIREGCGGELRSSAQSTSDAARVSGIRPVLSTLLPTHHLKPWASRLTLGSLS